MEIKINQVFVDAYNQGYRYMLGKDTIYPLEANLMKLLSEYAEEYKLKISQNGKKILFGKSFHLDLLINIPNKKGLKIWEKNA